MKQATESLMRGVAEVMLESEMTLHKLECSQCVELECVESCHIYRIMEELSYAYDRIIELMEGVSNA